jgi:hypothetical protein
LICESGEAEHLVHVAFGSFPDLDALKREVRFTVVNGQSQLDEFISAQGHEQTSSGFVGMSQRGGLANVWMINE